MFRSMTNGMVQVPLEDGDPTRLGRWRIRHRLGVGSGTVVYEADDGRSVVAAIKTVRPGGAAKEVARRLHAEGIALRMAGTDGVVRLREDAADAPTPYLAMERIDGPSLDELVTRRGPLRLAQVEVLGSMLAGVVARVHARGVVHGDVKPANVLCADSGPVLIDFDAATERVPSRTPAPGRGGSRGPLRLRPVVGPVEDEATVEWHGAETTRVVRATPRWLAPEQITGRPLEGQTDVFALGALLVYLCTGRSPFGSAPAEEMIRRVRHADPDLTGVDPSLAPLLSACLAKHPADRPTAADLSFELRPASPAGQRAA